MKIIEMEDDFTEEEYEQLVVTDFADEPIKLLEDFDRVLKPYGLEIVVYDDSSSDWYIAIKKIKRFVKRSVRILEASNNEASGQNKQYH